MSEVKCAVWVVKKTCRKATHRWQNRVFPCALHSLTPPTYSIRVNRDGTNLILPLRSTPTGILVPPFWKVLLPASFSDQHHTLQTRYCPGPGLAFRNTYWTTHCIYIFNFQNAKNQIFTLEILIPSLSWEITSCGCSSLQMSPCVQVAKAPPAGFTPIINCLVHTGIWYCHRWKLPQDKYGQMLFFLFAKVTNIMSRYRNHFQGYKNIKHVYEIMNCNDIALRNPTLSLFL